MPDLVSPAPENSACGQFLILHHSDPRNSLRKEGALNVLADGMLNGQRCSQIPFGANPSLHGALRGRNQQGLDCGQKGTVSSPLRPALCHPGWQPRWGRGSQRTWVGHGRERKAQEGAVRCSGQIPWPSSFAGERIAEASER